MADQKWTLEVFATESGGEPFTAFAEGLEDFEWTTLDAALRTILVVRGLELVRTEWLKPLGQGLHEFRIRHDADEISNMFGTTRGQERKSRRRILLRVFVHFHGNRVVLLLSGYDKGADPSERRQQREIADARRNLTAWQQQEARRGARRRKRGAQPPFRF